MAKYLDESQITGQVLDETRISGRDNLTRSLEEDNSTWSKIKAAAGDVARSARDRAATVGKVGAATADLFLGAPGQLVGIGADAGARLYALGSGESRAMQDAAGQAGREMVPEWLMSPVQSLARSAAGAQPLDQSVVSDAMSWLAHKGSAATGGKITPGGADSLINTFMGAGVTQMGAAMKVPLERALTERANARTAQGRMVAEDKVREALAVVEQQKAARLPTQELVERNVGVRSDADIAANTEALRRDIKKRSKQDAPLQEELTARAETQPGGEGTWTSGGKEYPVVITGEAMRGPDGAMYTPVRYAGQDSFVPASELKAAAAKAAEVELPKAAETVSKTRIGEPVEIGEVPTSLQTAREKLMSDRAWEMTSEERIALRNAVRNTPPLEVVTQGTRERLRLDEQTGARNFEKGEVDPDFIVGLGGGLALGTAAYTAYRMWEKSRAEAEEENRRGLDFMKQPGRGKGGLPASDVDQMQQEHQKDRKTFTMEDAVGPAALAGALGARRLKVPAPELVKETPGLVKTETPGALLSEKVAEVTPKEPQAGVADPKLLAGVAATGGATALGAYLDSDKPLRGAMLGAAGVGAFAALAAAKRGQGLDYTLGNVSTRLGEVNQGLLKSARDFERNVMVNTDKALDRIDPFVRGLKKLPEETKAALNSALLRGNSGEILDTVRGNEKMVKAYRDVQEFLKETGDTLVGMGRFKEGLTNYFPRVVEDMAGLKEALGTELRQGLDNTLAKAATKLGRDLTDVEASLVIDNWLKSADANSSVPGYVKTRKVKELTPELEKFYQSPTESLLRYAAAAVQDIEMAKFFGQDAALVKQGGGKGLQVDLSIGNKMERMIREGKLTNEQANEVRSLLKSRFEGGEKTMGGFWQDVRNATNLGLLGSLHSAATQIGDSVMTVYHQGLLPTLGALKDKLTGNSQVTAKEFGLVNHIAEELGTARLSGKALQTVFKYGGFAAIDQFAKGLHLNAALRKYQGWAKSESGQAQIVRKYGEAFGDELPQLLNDLKHGAKTDRVNSLLFSEISNAQPVTKLEVPQAYLDHPNGRLLYQMRTYMLKQMDVIRRDAYQEIRDGNYVRGARNLLGFATALSLSNIPGDIVKDWLSGRPLKLDKIDYVENLAKNFGLNRYTSDKISTSTKPGKAAVQAVEGMVKPAALSVAERLGAGASHPEELLPFIPGAGKALYDRFGGGNEKIERVERLRDKRDARDAAEKANPALKARRLERAKQRELKRQGATQ